MTSDKTVRLLIKFFFFLFFNIKHLRAKDDHRENEYVKQLKKIEQL
jgi:hypothetical protein